MSRKMKKEKEGTLTERVKRDRKWRREGRR